jgi:tetratricopeptide (TPR) repeat protein
LFFFAVLAIAQDGRIISSIRGVVASDQELSGSHLIVKLTEVVTHAQLERAFVAGDGSFELRNLPTGTYSVELLTANGESISQEMMNLNSSADRIEIRLPRFRNKPGPGETVSVRQLRNPLSAKSARMFSDAQKASEKGDYRKSIEILRHALKDPSAAPYARMNIGVDLMRAGQPADAVPELQDAVRLIPDDSAARANLAYALLLTQRLDAAEDEARRAVELDKNNCRARWIMGSILLTKGSRVEEGLEDLRLASREIPKARVMRAQFYERNGQREAAARELREFLPAASTEERAVVEQWLSKLAAK